MSYTGAQSAGSGIQVQANAMVATQTSVFDRLLGELHSSLDELRARGETLMAKLEPMMSPPTPPTAPMPSQSAGLVGSSILASALHEAIRKTRDALVITNTIIGRLEL